MTRCEYCGRVYAELENCQKVLQNLIQIVEVEKKKFGGFNNGTKTSEEHNTDRV